MITEKLMIASLAIKAKLIQVSLEEALKSSVNYSKMLYSK